MRLDLAAHYYCCADGAHGITHYPVCKTEVARWAQTGLQGSDGAQP